MWALHMFSCDCSIRLCMVVPSVSPTFDVGIPPMMCVRPWCVLVVFDHDLCVTMMCIWPWCVSDDDVSGTDNTYGHNVCQTMMCVWSWFVWKWCVYSIEIIMCMAVCQAWLWCVNPTMMCVWPLCVSVNGVWGPWWRLRALVMCEGLDELRRPWWCG